MSHPSDPSATSSRVQARGIAIAFLVVVACALGAGAWQLAHAQSQDREGLRDRYSGRAGIASALTDSLFRTAFQPTISAASSRFGDDVTTKALLAEQRRARSAYVAVLDRDGKLLGATPGAPARVRAGLQSYMQAAAGGQEDYALSDVLRGSPDLIETTMAFTAIDGSERLLVSAGPAEAYVSFLSSSLRPLAPTSGGAAFVLDRHGSVLGAAASAGVSAPTPDAELRRRAFLQENGLYHLGGKEQYIVSDGIPGTDWRIAIRIPTKMLYASVDGTSRWLPWVILALAALALGVTALLLGRVVTAGARVAKANAELERSEAQLRERAAELQSANGELKRSNADLEQFAYVASHDLSAPLRGIAGFSQLLGTRYKGKLDPKADEFIGHMQDGVARMQRIIDDLLLYSRVDRTELEARSLDLEQVLDETLRALGPEISDRNGMVTHDPLPVVRGEPTQLTQVLQNLIGNGLKFARPDVPPRVHIDAKPLGDRWRIEVRDNGIGIDPENVELIFKMFHRLHTAREYPGTGIGLAITKKIVDRHGGELTVHPSPDGGTIFAFTLDGAPADIAPATPASDAGQPVVA